MHTIRFLIISFLILMLHSACGKEPTEDKLRQMEAKQPAYGDIIVRGDIGDASNLIPLLASDKPSHDIAGLVYNGLVKYDKNMNIIGDLAESWDVSANGLIITFHLRKGRSVA
jgi:ABC-type dipeptide transport system, periplasmic component